MRYFMALAAVGAVLAVGASPARAAPVCGTYTAASGTTTFPGTFIGTVGSGSGQFCQIGDIAANNVSGSGTFVNSTATSSIYEFYWGGGTLGIQEKLGNNGIGDAVDVELYSLVSQTSTTTSSLISSIQIPFQSGPTSFFTVTSPTQSLAAGYYSIDTYLAIGNVTDPTFQINFTPGAAPLSEPSTVALELELAALGGLISVRRRRGSTLPPAAIS